MMNKYGTRQFFLLILSMIFVLMCGCTSSSKPQAEENVPVESVEEYDYSSDTVDSNSIDKIKKYLYSSEGNIAEVIQYSEDGEETLHRYEYDENNNLIKHYYYDYLIEEYIYEDNKCIAEKYYDVDGSLIELHEFKYVQGKLVSEYYESCIFPEVENSDGELIEVEFTEYFIREYNSAGKLAKETCYEYDSEPYTNEYIYSKNKTVMKSVTVSGEHFFTETITYDDKGREISIHWLFVEDDSTSETVYAYEDSQITETYFSNGEKLHYFVSGYNPQGYIVHFTAYSAENEIRRLIKFEYDENNHVNKIQRMQNEEISVQYAPEREYNADNQIVSEVYYSNVDYFSDSIMDSYRVQY